MFSHYVKIAIRSLSRSKAYSFINIMGLAVGMAVCLVIYQYIRFELSYDRFHENADNIYRLTTTDIRKGKQQGSYMFTTYARGAVGKETVPEIKSFVRVHPQDVEPVLINPENDRKYQEDGMWYVDGNFLQLFDFPLLYGNKKVALAGKDNIVLTAELSEKYFGDADPLGKPLRISLGHLSGTFTVGGVLAPLPENSHLQFNFLVPIEFVLERWPYEDDNGWWLPDFATYLLLDGNADPKLVEQKLGEAYLPFLTEDMAELDQQLAISLQPLTEVHLKSNFPTELAADNGDIQNIKSFALIAAFVLLMAWINYINLSTARSWHRSKEVSIRKSIGAYRQQLITQFMTESLIINIIAAGLSVVMAALLLPFLNQITSKNLTFSVFQDPRFWAMAVSALLLGALFSGLYPAFILSGLKPISVFGLNASSTRKGLSLRKGLILFQFFISMLLIAGTLLVHSQIIFMKKKDLGIDIEKVLAINGPRVYAETLEEEGETDASKRKAFENELRNHHSVKEVAAMSNIPGKGYFYTEGYWVTGESRNSEKRVSCVMAGTHFPEVFDMEFIAKVPFDETLPADQYAIVNEEAVRALGLGTPEEALHAKITNGGDVFEILGVIKDLNWTSLKDAYSPVVFSLNNYYGAYYCIKIDLADLPSSIAHVEQAFHSVFPNDPFEYFFLDDSFNRQYQADLQFGKLFSAFSLLAIFISCLGLFALVSFSASLKTKEIGIRKVLGASVGQVMSLLSKEYLVLLLVASLLAVPLVLWGGQQWLENYAFRIEMGAEFIVVPVVVLLVISLLTVSYKTWTAARANPVNSLRTE